MAFTTIFFKHPVTQAMKEAPVGFSWTVFFFGFLPALFRSDWKWALIMLICACITVGLSNLVFMFLYNKLYIKDLINAGYKADSIASGDMAFAASYMNMALPQNEKSQAA